MNSDTSPLTPTGSSNEGDPDATLRAPGSGPTSPRFSGYPELAAGQSLGSFGSYELFRHLGSGGFGDVHLALDRRLSRRVALKIMRRAGPVSAADLEGFEREARITARLDHPGICPIYETGIEVGMPFIAMRFIEGETLARLVSDSSVTGARGWLRRLVGIVERVARALHAAHEAGVVHRDVKPGNVIVTPDGQPILVDFGLARDFGQGEATMTRTGEVFGTPGYLAPEVLQGKKSGQDRRVDVWALGVMLYEGLAKRRPFDAPTREALYQSILTSEPTRLSRVVPDLPRDLEVISEMALAKDPNRRFQSAEAFADDLAAWLDGRPIAARRIGVLGRIVRWARRERAAAAFVSLALVAFPLVATLTTLHFKNQEPLARAKRAELEARKEAQLDVAFALLGEGRPAAARARFVEVEGMEGGSAEATMGHVLSLLGENRHREALTLLDQTSLLVAPFRAAGHLRAECLAILGEGEAHKPNDLPDASSAMDYFLIGTDELLRGQAGEAQAYARAVLALTQAVFHAPAPRALYHEMRVFAAGYAGDERTVRESMGVLTALWPSAASAPGMIGAALHKLGHAEEGLVYLDRAVARDPTSTIHLFNRGCAYLRLERSEPALHDFDATLAFDQTYAMAHFNRGLCLERLQRTNDATEAFGTAYRLEPAAVSFVDRYVVSLERQNQPALALEVLEHALTVDPKNPNFIGWRARLKLDAGDVVAADAGYREAVALSGKNTPAHTHLGLIARGRGRIADAVKHFEAAKELTPDDPDVLTNLANSYKDMDRIPEAIGLFERAIAIAPTHVMAQYNYGGALSRAGQKSEAIQAYQKVLALSPDLTEARINLALIYLENRREPEALSELKDAVTRAPRHPKALANYGVALEANGLFPEAVLAYRSSTDADPAYAFAHASLGQALREVGRYSEALESMKRAHELGSKLPNWRRPTGRWITELEELVIIEQRFVALEEKREIGAAGKEVLLLAELASRRGHDAQALNWYRPAFEAVDPRLFAVPARHFYRAALSALALSARDSANATTLRKEALRYFQHELEIWNVALTTDAIRKDQLRTELNRWLRQTPIRKTDPPSPLVGLSLEDLGPWTAFVKDLETCISAAQ